MPLPATVSEVLDPGPGAKKAVGDAPVLPLLMMGLGSYLMWYAVHYWRQQGTAWPTDPIKAVLQGKAIPPASPAPSATASLDAAVLTAATTPTAGGGSGGSGSGTVLTASTGSALADDALKYQGHCYSYGGAPGPDGTGCWDCSSFCSYVLGHDEGLNIPGGTWSEVTSNGTVHGPATTDYLLYGTAISEADVQAGDLIVYDTHMGIAISNTEMISAEDPDQGTATSTIAGMTSSLGETANYRRATS